MKGFSFNFVLGGVAGGGGDPIFLSRTEGGGLTSDHVS